MIFDAFSIEFGTPVGTANTFSQSVPVKTNTHTPILVKWMKIIMWPGSHFKLYIVKFRTINN